MVTTDDKSLITETINHLRAARGSLEKLRSDYRNNPEILGFYEPSAIFIVEQLEAKLIELIKKETGSQFLPEAREDKVDFWIRIEGEEFHNGKGPIGQVGTFLSKFNNANKNVINLIEHKKGNRLKASELPSFDLVATKAGSLRLGLRQPDTNSDNNQLDLFYGEDNWCRFKESVEQAKLATKGLQVLVKAIASANNEEALNELNEEFDEKEVIKIIHFAKDLTPSNRSPFDAISFEGDQIGTKEKVIRTDKLTRKLLSEHAKKLSPSTEYIEGTAVIGGADVHNKSLTARPLKFNDTIHDEIRCFFTKEVTPEEIKEYLNQLVELSGYLIHDKNNRLLRLEIDEIEIKHKED